MFAFGITRVNHLCSLIGSLDIQCQLCFSLFISITYIRVMLPKHKLTPTTFYFIFEPHSDKWCFVRPEP